MSTVPKVVAFSRPHSAVSTCLPDFDRQSNYLILPLHHTFSFQTHKPSRLTPRSSRDSPALAREAVELDCRPSRNTEFRLVQIFVSWSCVSQCFPRKWSLNILSCSLCVSLRARKFADEILRSVEKTHSVAESQETFAAFLGAPQLWEKMAKNGEDVHPF